MNTADGSWYIPAYNADSRNEARLGCCSSNLDFLNYHGLFERNDTQMRVTLQPILKASALNAPYTLQKIDLNDDGTYTVSSDEEEIKSYADISDDSAPYSQNINFILGDKESAYLLKLEEKDDVDLMLRSSEELIHLRFENSDEVIIDTSGMIKAAGDTSDFSVTMVSNDGYSPTDWHRVDVSGEGAQVEFRRTDDGYVLSGDDLTDVKVSAEGKTYEPECTFSTEKDTVLIHEITEDKIGISVDADSNGTFEQEIGTAEVTGIILGDINTDGIVDANDASEILSLYAQASTGGDIGEETKNTGDVNKDGLLDSTDASLILEYYTLASTSEGINAADFFREKQAA